MVIRDYQTWVCKPKVYNIAMQPTVFSRRLRLRSKTVAVGRRSRRQSTFAKEDMSQLRKLAVAIVLPAFLASLPARHLAVHPGLPWVEIQSTAEKVDRCFEVLAVSVAADASLHGHDFAVDCFGHGVGDSVSAVAHHVR